jgi:hypothetical protein
MDTNIQTNTTKLHRALIQREKTTKSKATLSGAKRSL